MSILDDLASLGSGIGDDAQSWYSALAPKLSSGDFWKSLIGEIPALGAATELNTGPYASALRAGEGLVNDFRNGTLSAGNQAVVNAFRQSAEGRVNQNMANRGIAGSTAANTALDSADQQAALLQARLQNQQLNQGMNTLNAAQQFGNAGNGLTNVQAIGGLIGKLFGNEPSATSSSATTGSPGSTEDINNYLAAVTPDTAGLSSQTLGDEALPPDLGEGGGFDFSSLGAAPQTNPSMAQQVSQGLSGFGSALSGLGSLSGGLSKLAGSF